MEDNNKPQRAKFPASNGTMASVFDGFSRSEVLGLAFGVLVANGIAISITSDISSHGFYWSASNTFGISAFIWIAAYFSLSVIRSADTDPAQPLDLLLLIGSFLAAILPFGNAIWVVASAVALYFIVRSSPQSPAYQVAWIMLALCYPMYWSKRIFSIFSDSILQADAMLVSTITNTERIDNLVRIPGEDGFLQIAPGCSSFANISLVVVCWVLMARLWRLRWHVRNFYWAALAGLAVIALNVSRIALIGFFPAWYEFIHNGPGQMVANWLETAAIAGVCYYGARRRAETQAL